MRKKGLLMTILSSIMALSICSSVVALAGGDAETPGNSLPSMWTVEKAGDSQTWTVGNSGELINENTNFLGNLLMTTNSALDGDYVVEATFAGTYNESNPEVGIGLIPWYKDSDNYVAAFLKWNPNDAYLINAQLMYCENGSIAWGDNWLDFAYEGFYHTMNTATAFTMKVEKTAKDGADHYAVTVKTGEVERVLAERDIALSYGYEGTPKVGLYSFNTKATFTGFKSGKIWAETPATWTMNADGTMTNTNTGFTGNFLITDIDASEDYSMKATFTGSADNTALETNMGFVPWFKDGSNFVCLYLKWNPNDQYLINCQMMYVENGAAQWGDNWLDFAYDGYYHTLPRTESFTILVSKVRDGDKDVYTMTVTVGEVTNTLGTRSISLSATDDAAKAGIYTFNDTVTVSDFTYIKAEKPQVDDRWSEQPECWTTNEDKSMTSTNDGFTGNFLMTKIDASEDYSMQATFTGSADDITKETNMGFVPWYKDASNFVCLYLKWNPNDQYLINCQMMYVVDGAAQWGDNWLDFAFDGFYHTLPRTESFTILVSKVRDGDKDVYTMTVTVGEVTNVLGTRSISLSVTDDAAKAGIYTFNDTVTVSNFTYIKSEEPQVEVDTRWSEQPECWTTNEDKSMTSTNASFTGNFLMTKVDASKDHMMQATFTGSADNIALETNMGFVPWYKDSNNFVCVFLKWNPGDQNLINCQLMYKEDGNVSWGDNWLDHAYDGYYYTLPRTQTFVIKVEKVRTEDGDKYSVTVTTGDVTNVLGTRVIAMSATNADAKAGIYTCNDTVNVSDFLFEYILPEEVENDYWTIAPGAWTFYEDGSMVSENSAFTSNFLLTSQNEFYGDYAVEATFEGSNKTEITKEVNMGIVPWYINDSNYVLIYMAWRPQNGFNLINVQTIAYTNGVFSGWNDHWLDYKYASTLFTLKNTDVITMRVEKKLNAYKTADTYTVIISCGEMCETPAIIDFEVSAPYAATKAKAGLYTNNEKVTVTNWNIESLTESGVYKYLDGATGAARSSAANGWAYADGKYTVNAAQGDAAQNQAIVKNDHKDGNYVVSYTATMSASDVGTQLSVLPYYSNENNYVRFVLEKAASGSYVYVEGAVAGVAFSNEKVAYDAVDFASVELSAAKIGTKFLFKVNGATALTYSNDNLLDGANVAIGAGYANVEFSNVETVESAYVPFDWYNEKGWYISANTQADVMIDDEQIVMAQTSDTENLTRIYRASNKYNNLDVYAEYTADENAMFGIYPYYVSDTDFVAAFIDGGTVYLVVHHGEEVDLGENGHAEAPEAGKLRVVMTFGHIEVYVGETKVLDYTDEEIADVETGNYGFFTLGGATITSWSVNGFVPYSPYQQDGWTLRGSRLNTWTVTENGVVGNCVGGTSFKDTLALKDNAYSPAEGFYLGSKITITELTGVEWKTAIVPYYVDGGNHIFVWLSQWSGNTTTITITARLNNATVGTEWRETSISYTMKDYAHYLEIRIDGDSLYVYLNKSYAPAVSTKVEGLSNAPKGRYAMNIFNTSAKFEEVTLSQDRIFTVTEEPTLEIIGTLPTTATVGDIIKLPVVSAEAAGGATAEVAITVLGPDANEVAIDKNSFSVAKAGVYTINITAVDAWNNTRNASYTLTVSEKSGQGEDSTGESAGQTESQAKTSLSCNSSIEMTTVFALCLVMAAMIIFFRKKED